jgi:hypothetical protein
MVGEAKPDLRGERAYKRSSIRKEPLMVERLSRSLSKLLYMGARIVHAFWSTNNRACPRQGG